MSDMTPEDWAAESREQAALLRRAALVLAQQAAAVDVTGDVSRLGPDAVCPMPADHPALRMARLITGEAP